MKQLIIYELEEGGEVIVEVDKPDIEGGISQAGREEICIPEKAAVKFGEAFERVRPAAEKIIQKFKNLNQEPDKVEVEFGLKMNAESGAILASAGIESNFRITLTWSKKGY